MDDQIWNLLAKKVANELLPEEEKELERLLQQHPDASYTKGILTQDWKDKQKPFSPEEVDIALAKHKLRLESAMSVAEETPSSSRRGNIRRMTIRIAGVAAALLMAFFMGRKWWSQPKMAEDNRQQLVTHKGSRSQVKLPDGTTVWLNAGSKLDYPKQFTGKQREVTLEGEAFFTVAKDAQRPFTVRTRTFSIRVLGTEFNVRAYPQEDSAVTSLLTGEVEVVLDEKKNQVVRLKPNEKLSIPTAVILEEAATVTDEPVVIKLTKSPLTILRDTVITETAWVENKLAFKKVPLEKVAVMLEQWFGAEIRFKNNNKRQEYLTGVFQTESLTEVLEALELTGTFRFKKDAEGIIWIE